VHLHCQYRGGAVLLVPLQIQIRKAYRHIPHVYRRTKGFWLTHLHDEKQQHPSNTAITRLRLTRYNGANTLHYTIVHSFPEEAWPSLGHTTANKNSGVGTASNRSLQLQLGSVRDVCIISSSIHCSVVSFYGEAIASPARL
jgi:hypothetical protein